MAFSYVADFMDLQDALYPPSLPSSWRDTESHEKALRYEHWIEERVYRANGFGYGKCRDIATEMVAAFPELSLRKGVFVDRAIGRRTHWWVRDPEGRIVDPTARQHPVGKVFPADESYYEDMTDWTEEQIMAVVPTGRCMNCGGDVYWRKTFCNDKCAKACGYSVSRTDKRKGELDE